MRAASTGLQPAQRWAAHTAAIRATLAQRERRPTPEKVVAHARLIALDTIGCALAGRRAPEVAALERQAAALEPGEFRFPGGRGLALHAACRVLAVAPTWHEACEGHAFAHGRPGVPAIAALLPLALQRGADIGEFTDALAVGYEVGARAGAWLRMAPGLHVDGNWPALGVAAGVARLLGPSAEAGLNAVQIAACQLPSSLYLPIRTGRNVRNLYLAHSAALGLDSALAAMAGIAAPADALAWYAEHCCPADPEALPAAATDLILDAYLKPFAAVRHVHYGAVAARRIRAQLQGPTQSVTKIVLAIYEEANVYCCNPRPATPLAAQFSLSFGIAAMLRFGELDAASYEAPCFEDAELRRLESLVEVRIDPELTARRERGASLQVTAGGRTLQQRVGPGPDPELLVDAPAAVVKFARNAAPQLPRHSSEEFCSAFLDAPAATPLRDVWRLLSPAHASNPA